MCMYNSHYNLLETHTIISRFKIILGVEIKGKD